MAITMTGRVQSMRVEKDMQPMDRNPIMTVDPEIEVELTMDSQQMEGIIQDLICRITTLESRYNSEHFAPILKVKRNGFAKQFPLIKTAKEGDVGYDLPSIMPVKKKYVDMATRMLAMGRDDIPVEWFKKKILWPFCRTLISTGYQVECPAGHWGSLEARSSTSKRLMIVPKGVIDEGYRGEMFGVLINVGIIPRIIRHGERYIQLIIHERKTRNMTVEEVDNLSATQRGSTGFGSTGQGHKSKQADKVNIWQSLLKASRSLLQEFKMLVYQLRPSLLAKRVDKLAEGLRRAKIQK